MRTASLLAAAVLLTAAEHGRAQGLEVVSALGDEIESQARKAVLDARQAYAELGLGLRKPDLPVEIVLLPTVIELAPYIGPGAGRSRAFSFPGNDRNYIVLAWSAPGNALRAAAHEYAHLVDPLAEAPPWFREGFAEYLSYFERGEGGRLVPRTPARHLVRLRDSAWLPFDELWSASRGSAAFRAPTFYAQSWLTVHWLGSRGKAARDLRPEDLTAALAELGEAGVEAALRAHFAGMDPAPPAESGQLYPSPGAYPGRAWEVELALAEVDRELDRGGRALAALEQLQIQRPGNPAVAAALGALAMDEGRYEEAERWLGAASEDSRTSARTRYRLALMLLQPAGGRTRERARAAARQARLALEQVPDAPDYRLTLAQALMVDEQWEASARVLNTVAEHAAWRLRANEEMDELVRRRQQALAELPRPAVAPAPQPEATAASPLRLAPVPKPPPPPPPPPMRWPPPGATILAGRIDFVDCRGPDKIIVMRHPLLSLRIRERKGKPAKLFHAPEKGWTEIPCGAKGWTVNIAYYTYQNELGILGTAAAILF